MNLLEALKAGHPIRRESTAGLWLYPNDNPQWRGVGLTREDLLAEDWVAQEPDETLRAWINKDGAVIMIPGGNTNYACQQLGWARAEWLDQRSAP
jgi:hypothetical protein